MNLRRTDNRKYPTLYASALLTLTKQGYTKHYFEGSRRICSKIGGGFSNVPQSDIDRRVAPVEPDYDEMHNSQRDGLVRTFAECLGAHPEPDAARDLREVVDGCLALNDPEPAFFYISDHLGGTSFLANASGNLTQTLSYLPYGEDWADVQNFAETRYPRLGIYTYNGKEKDYESSYHYFGARYYDCEALTGWLSVDPMADKYPSMSPYAYCAWNPVKLVDPDGREIGDYYSESGKLLGSDGLNDGKIYIVPSWERKKVKNGNFDVEKYELPSLEARQQICDYLERSDQEDNLREYGGAIWENNLSGEQEIRYALPGPKWNGTDNASINTNDYGDDEFNAHGKGLLTFFHSHFSGTMNDRVLELKPSTDDLKNVRPDGINRFAWARLPYNIMAAMRTREVYLYTETGVGCQMDFDVFKTVGRK